MNWDLIIFLIILICFFVGLILFVKKAPVYFAKYRAKTFGLDLTIEEAKIAQKNFCIKKEFFEGVKGIREQHKIPIEKLANHFLANGNLSNILEGIKELKSRNRNVDFNILSAIDLAGKDLKSEIIACDQEQLLQTSEQVNDSLKISLEAKYKFGFPESIWADKQPEEIQRKIEEKIVRFLNSWEHTEPLKTEQFLRENILNIDFWEKELRVVLVQQTINSKKKK
ncbi:hypothetical protein [Algoriphagus sp. CAU 1675]|uniref:hypothetical protein n=1 Tax=Algoriphagus sp. CAU 1675 TaxID=3032597 RepID=UPI0023DA0F33|nr:hypothetical protein [Algoriphagus sp. CAU 1675]MDF2159136.1 hypothetical protein [Algoriphagus sp. CAU 1675]